MTIQITPIARSLGAIVSGVNLNDDLTQFCINRLGELLIEHQVLLFRDQPVTPQAQARFAARFGSLHVHPIYPCRRSCRKSSCWTIMRDFFRTTTTGTRT